MLSCLVYWCFVEKLAHPSPRDLRVYFGNRLIKKHRAMIDLLQQDKNIFNLFWQRHAILQSITDHRFAFPSDRAIVTAEEIRYQ